MSDGMERDSMGEVRTPAECCRGAQTRRSAQNFRSGTEKMPLELLWAFGVLKQAAAVANYRLGRLDEERMALISRVCGELSAGKLDEHVPPAVWRPGSGTQSNMSLNEVIANRGNELAGKKLLHPDDHVNMSQSSNDIFPAAMNIAAVVELEDRLFPALRGLCEDFRCLAQESRGWRDSLEQDRILLELALPPLRQLALGTALNAPKGFDRTVVQAVSEIVGRKFLPVENDPYTLTGKDELVFAHGGLKTLAMDLMKIANDVRWLGEGRIPANQSASSAMPGRVNPSQCEAVTIVAVQVMANDVAVGIAASQGSFERNVFMPVCACNFLQSVRLLADCICSFQVFQPEE